MHIELGILHDGSVMMVSDQPLRDMVCRIEYYRDQHLFVMVYDDSDSHGDEMMNYEIPQEMRNHVEDSANILIYSLYPNREPIGYRVPLIQVGDVY